MHDQFGPDYIGPFRKYDKCGDGEIIIGESNLLFEKICQLRYGEYIREMAQWLGMKAKTIHKI